MATEPQGQTRHGVSRSEVLSWQRRVSGRPPEEVLGVARDADEATVRRAFTTLARRYHPDAAHAGDGQLRAALHEALIAVTEAYRALVREPRRPGAPAAPAAPRGPVGASRSAPAVPPTIPGRPSAPRGATPPAPPQPFAPPTAPTAPGPDRRQRVEQALAAAGDLLARGEAEAAVSALHEVLTGADDRTKRRVRLLLARAYVSRREWRRYGLSLLHGMLAEDPRDVDALALLGGLYHREGLVARAEGTLRHALAADPGHTEARILMRAVRAERGRREDAPPTRETRQSRVRRLLSLGRAR
jgi:hypothetical protein